MLLLRLDEERLLPERLLLPLLALARSLLPELLLRLELLRPLEAVPRLLLLLREDEGLEDEDELRDGMSCSLEGGRNTDRGTRSAMDPI